MPNQKIPSSTPSHTEQEVQVSQRTPSLARFRVWLNSRTGRVLVPMMTLLAGIILGVAAVFLFGQNGAGPIAVVPATSRGDITVEADRTFITQLVTKNLDTSGMPGKVQNVTLNLVEGDQMIASGEDVFTLLGVQVSRPFTFTVQLYVNACVLKIHILHAEISNIAVTGIAQSFESQINQQLVKQPEGLPSGFQYCISSVRTETAKLYITYTAIPD